MNDKDNYLKNAELHMEQDYSHIDGILNNMPAPLPEPERKPKDRVIPPPKKNRSRDRDDR